MKTRKSPNSLVKTSIADAPQPSILTIVSLAPCARAGSSAVSLMRFATSSVGRRRTMDGWPPSGPLGSSIPPIISPRLSLATAIPNPSTIRETETTYVVAWQGKYRVDGPAFTYTDRRSRRVSTILGYPINLLVNPPSHGNFSARHGVLSDARTAPGK